MLSAIRVSYIKGNIATLTIHLTAQEMPWSQVAHNYIIDVGKLTPQRRVGQIRVRSDCSLVHLKECGEDAIEKGGDAGEEIIGKTKNAGEEFINKTQQYLKETEQFFKDVAEETENMFDRTKALGQVVDNFDETDGNGTIPRGFTPHMQLGKPNQEHTIWDDRTHLNLTCVNCYMEGIFEVQAQIIVIKGEVANIILDVDPRDFRGAFILRAETNKYRKPDRLKSTKPLGDVFDTRVEKALYSVMIPEVGFMVPEMFKVGAWATYEIGGQVTFQGSSTISFGATLDVPNNAHFHVDAGRPRSSNLSGFNGTLAKVFDIKAFSGQAQLSLYAQTKLYFGIELEDVGRADIAFAFKMPQLSNGLVAGYDEAGFCEKAGKSLQAGVQLIKEIGLQLDLQIEKYKGKTKDKKPWYWMNLWKHYSPISDPECLSVPISGPEINASETRGLDELQHHAALAEQRNPAYTFREGDSLLDPRPRD